MNVRWLCACLLTLLPATAGAITPAGIVFEAEDVCEPKSAWQKDRFSSDHWTLWTTEPDIQKKRSGGAVLASPHVTRDRQRPEEGAPPLHAVVRGLKPGAYRVLVSPPGRPLAYSLDGQQWTRYAGGELSLGIRHLGQQPFELWIDDRFAAPSGNPGPAYFDYVRFVPVPPLSPGVRIEEPWKGLAWWLQHANLGRAVRAEQWQLEGFQRDYSAGAVKTAARGARCWYVVPDDGTFYPAVQVGQCGEIGEISLALDGKELAHLVNSEAAGGSRLLCLTQAVTAHRGQRLELTNCRDQEPCCIEGLYLGSRPVALPEIRIENVAAWSTRPGEVELCWTTSRMAETGVVEYGSDGLTQHTAALEHEGQNHRVVLRNLDPHATYQARITGRHGGQAIVSEVLKFPAAPSPPPATAMPAMRLAVPEPTAASRPLWPTTIGMPFSRGSLASTAELALRDAAGKPVLLQAEPWSRWPDGSIAWAILDFHAQPTAAGEAYTLSALPGTDRESDRSRPTAFDATLIPGGGPGVLFQVQREHYVTPIRLELTAGDGGSWSCAPPDPASIVREVEGPVQRVLKFSGSLMARDGSRAWTYLVRLSQWDGQPAIGVDLSLCNDQPQPKTRSIKSLVLRLPLEGPNVNVSVLGGAEQPLAAGQEIRVLQDRDDHFTRAAPQGTQSGTHADGVLSAAGARQGWTALWPSFWQTYPAALSARPEALDVELLPRLPTDLYADPASRKVFARLFAWYQDGNYLMRAGQLTRRQVLLIPQALPGAEGLRQLTWWSRPLVPQAPREYLCHSGVLGRTVEPPRAGVWDAYETMFTRNFALHLQDRQRERTYGWMHYGDWFGERVLNYGNNEYDMAWALAVQWMRTAEREYFDRGLEMARHYSSVDTLHGAFTDELNGLVFEHSLNHVGTERSPEELHLDLYPHAADYLRHYGRSMFRGAIDRQGHVFQEGNWIFAALAGDRFLDDEARRICTNQAFHLTRGFDFSIERAGGWPLINAAAAYRHTSDPYYLNAARLMVQRCLERQDPHTGGWLHYPPLDETAGVPTLGGKAFATGILTYGLLRYLDVEPRPRPDVRHMLVRAADWLRNESWLPDRGFRYISNCPPLEPTAGRGLTSLLNAEVVAFAYQETHAPRYLEFWKNMMRGVLESNAGTLGKGFAQGIHQTWFGLERISPWVRQ